MNALSGQKDRKAQAPTREAIIGLGEASFKKSYYPALQQKVADLEELNNRYRTLIRTIPDIFLGCTPEGEISNYAPEAGNDEGLVKAILQHSEVLRELSGAIDFARRNRVFIPYNFVFPYGSKVYYFEARINITATGEALIIIRDMTEHTLIEMELRDVAEKDSLTKLHNRRYFEEKLAGYDGRFGEDFSIILADIDGLKIINDTIGHRSGDRILMAFSMILKDLFGRIGHIARVGGDEFGIILVGYPQEKIEELLESSHEKIEEYNREPDAILMSISYGYSHMNSGTINTQALYQEADDKMYQNKLLKEASNKNSFVKTLMKTLEAKDYITEGHASRMENLAEMTGKALRVSQHCMDKLTLLARFHDIGKVGIPDSILFKPAKLSEEEWAVMKTHSSIGKRIADASVELRDIAEMIYHHHEKWDGTGYPAGLHGEEIPIECRILSIVDAFDAMTNDRPYRRALSSAEALKQLREGAGTQFDEKLVDLFITQYHDNYNGTGGVTGSLLFAAML